MSDTSEDEGTSPNSNCKELVDFSDSPDQKFDKLAMASDNENDHLDPDKADDTAPDSPAQVCENGVEEVTETTGTVTNHTNEDAIESAQTIDNEIGESTQSTTNTERTGRTEKEADGDPLKFVDTVAETSEDSNLADSDDQKPDKSIIDSKPTIKLVPLSNLMAPSKSNAKSHIKSKDEGSVYIIDSTSDSESSAKSTTIKRNSNDTHRRKLTKTKNKSVIEITDSTDDSDVCIQEMIRAKKMSSASGERPHTKQKAKESQSSPPLITKTVKVKLSALPKDLSVLMKKHKLSEIRNEKQEIVARCTRTLSIASTNSNAKDSDSESLLTELKNPRVTPVSSNNEQDETPKIRTRLRTRRKNSESNDESDNRRQNLRLSKRLKENISKSKPSTSRARWRNVIDEDSESGGSTKMRKKVKPRSVKSASESDVDDRDIASTSKAGFTDNDSNDSAQEASDNENANNGASDSDFVANEGKPDGGSDSDFVQPSKKRRVMSRRREKAASSGEKDSQDDDYDSDVNKKKKKKRKRIRVQKSDSSDEYDEDGVKKKGRKNIRKVIKNRDLDDETKEAARTEQERKKRIEDRQKMYNQIYDEKPEEVKELNTLVLDFDEETKEELLSVDRKLVKKLKPHQAKGVKFMWDACFESLAKMEENNGSGCILAHCMGLGKTLQVVTLIHTLLSNSDATNVEKVLVICPVSTVLNWVNEFKIWLRHCEANRDIEIYEISRFKQNSERAYQIKEWHQDGGVMIMGYDMFRNLSSDNKRIKKKLRDTLQRGLVEPGPDLVVCDEGHLLKNSKTSLSKAVNRIRTLRRIVLTGTPLQNNLNEYYCMVQFVKPNLLGKYNEYLNRFVNPITNGQYTDSTPHDITMMKRRSHILHNLLDGCVQRKDYSVLAPFLPPKQEYVVYINLTKIQCDLYKYYMENRPNRLENQPTRSSVLFADFQNLQRIWTHPRVLRYNSDRYEINARKKRDLLSDDEEGSLKDFIDDDDDDESEMSSSGSEKTFHSSDSEKKDAKQARRTRATAKDLSEPEVEEVVKEENPTEWWMPLCPEEELDNLEHSGKLMLLFSILAECEAIGDKLLVFSQSLYSLDVIEHFLGLMDGTAQNPDSDAKLGGYTGSWTQGLDYFRLDGSTNIENRNTSCKHFNSESNTRARLFLISTRAGGLGINLVAANRVVIFDVSWNPSHDIQSIFRVYRFGQKKPCYIYRFVSLGTMEEKIYERQVTKLAISKRVIDEHQIDRHYKETDLMELYKVDIEPEEPRQPPMLPKDRLFAEQLRKFEDRIYKYHEHDSLLENKSEETLSQDEIKAAWEEFEAEKTRPQIQQNFIYTHPPRPQGSGPVTSNQIFGFRTDVLLQLLNLRARKEYPQASQQSIAQIVPLLLKHLYETMGNGNPSFYQELVSLQSALETPFTNQGNFPNSLSGPSTSSNNVVYTTQPPYHNNLIQQAQNRLMNIGNTENNLTSTVTNSNQIIEID